MHGSNFLRPKKVLMKTTEFNTDKHGQTKCRKLLQKLLLSVSEKNQGTLNMFRRRRRIKCRPSGTKRGFLQCRIQWEEIWSWCSSPFQLYPFQRVSAMPPRNLHGYRAAELLLKGKWTQFNSAGIRCQIAINCVLSVPLCFYYISDRGWDENLIIVGWWCGWPVWVLGGGGWCKCERVCKPWATFFLRSEL